jgi:hypothetical protein
MSPEGAGVCEGIDLRETFIVFEISQCFFSREHKVEGTAQLLKSEDVLKPNILITSSTWSPAPTSSLTPQEAVLPSRR